MKRKFNYSLIPILSLTFFFFSLSNAKAQENSRKKLREEHKLEKQKQTTLLVNSKEFVFVAEMVTPQGGRFINLTTNDYTVEFRPDSIKSDLPFFGRAYSGVGYGGDNGMKFEGKPKDFIIEKRKKYFSIKVDVRGEHDFYSLSLSVYLDGSGYLTINSNNRSAISYSGLITSIQKK